MASELTKYKLIIDIEHKSNNFKYKKITRRIKEGMFRIMNNAI